MWKSNIPTEKKIYKKIFWNIASNAEWKCAKILLEKMN